MRPGNVQIPHNHGTVAYDIIGEGSDIRRKGTAMSNRSEDSHPWGSNTGDHGAGERHEGVDAGAAAGQGSSQPRTEPFATTPPGQGAAGDGYDAYGRASSAQDGYSSGERHGQQSGAYQNASYPQGGYQESAYQGGGYAGTAYATQQPQQDRKRRFGAGTLVTGMAVAALIGGGVAAGTTGVLAGQDSSGTGTGTTQSSTTIVNNTDSVNAVTAAAQKASPSVVTISVTGGSSSGTGSGVILDDKGHILTNTHVVTLDGAVANATAEVQLSDGTVRKAQVVGTDPTSDLAVIKIDPSGLKLTPATLGESGKINVGDVAVAIGAPLGLSGTVTDGIVSTLNRTISVASSAAPEGGDTNDDSSSSPFQFQFPDQDGNTQSTQSKSTISLGVLQTDAAINPGNSGGALVNSDGEVIGINVAIASAGSQQGSDSSSESSGNIGVGFSIPIDYAKRVAQEIIDNGSASHGLLGASVASSPANDDSSQAFSDGAVIKKISSNGPAQKAGLSTGDVITEFNGKKITDAESLTAAVREAEAGASVKVSYQHGSSSKTAEVTLGDAKDAG